MPFQVYNLVFVISLLHFHCWFPLMFHEGRFFSQIVEYVQLWTLELGQLYAQTTSLLTAFCCRIVLLY